jgi:dihydroorotase
MKKTLFKNAKIINEGVISENDLLVVGQRIEKIASSIEDIEANVIDLKGKWLMPGIIDDQVHFREPGLTHKADIASESVAAIAGGVTSFMEMPNTNPQSVTQEALEKKYAIAARNSPANYSFFMGATNDNLEEILKTDPATVCGLKIFMGSSTGNMLVDNLHVLESIFSKVPFLIATHCEDEHTIKHNLLLAREKFGEDIPASEHPVIRNHEACYKSSSFAIELAKNHGTRLHVLHLTTAIETQLFESSIPLHQKKITSEVCVHHLYFNDEDYASLGNLIKCNPAIKTSVDQEKLLESLLDDRIDVVATDHAPHTLEEKNQGYIKSPSGLPLVQHGLPMLLDFYHKGKMTAEKIVEKMAHAPAICFKIKERGFIREGYFADLIVVDPEKIWSVQTENILYKCRWSPLEGKSFRGKVISTMVNGRFAYLNETIQPIVPGMRLQFTNA